MNKNITCTHKILLSRSTRAQATLHIAISLTHRFLNGNKPQQLLWGQNVTSTTYNTNTQIRRRSLYDSSYEVIKSNRRSHFQTRKNKPRCNIRDIAEDWNLLVCNVGDDVSVDTPFTPQVNRNFDKPQFLQTKLLQKLCYALQSSQCSD